MATKIDIVSNAFLLIGTPTINSLNDGSSRANVAANLYESTLDALLTMTRWRFAHKRASLNRLVEKPAHTYEYAYQLPSDYLMLESVYPYDLNYEVYGDKLYSNQTTVTLDYINRPDESKFPPYFLKCLEYRLAAEFAVPITENRTLKDSLMDDFKMALMSAMFADSHGRPSREPIDQPFISVRY